MMLRDDEKHFHIAKIRVPFGYIDGYGYLWHGHALRFFEAGRSDIVRGRGLEAKSFLDMNIALPIVSVNVDYHAPAYDDDPLDIYVSLNRPELPMPFLTFDFVVTRESDGAAIFSGKTKQVMVKTPSNRAIVRVPTTMQQRLESLWDYLERDCKPLPEHIEF